MSAHSTKYFNTLLKSIVRTDNLKKENISTKNQLKEKINDSFELIYTKLRHKQSELLNKVDKIAEKRNESITNIDFEMHQLLGNLSTYALIATNLTTHGDQQLELIPDTLEFRLKKLESEINLIEQQNEVRTLRQLVSNELNSIDKSIVIVKMKQIKEDSKQSFVNQSYRESLKEWLFSETSINDHQITCETIEEPKRPLNVSEWLFNSLENKMQLSMDSSTITNITTTTNDCDDDYSYVVEKDGNDFDDEENEQEVIKDDGVSKIWNKIKAYPVSFWLAH